MSDLLTPEEMFDRVRAMAKKPTTYNHSRAMPKPADEIAALRAEVEKLKPQIEGLEYQSGALENDVASAEKERDALAKFKTYVHQRLDDAGVPVDPESPHKAAGCRIGGRLDYLFGLISKGDDSYAAIAAERDELRAEQLEWSAKAADLQRVIDGDKTLTEGDVYVLGALRVRAEKAEAERDALRKEEEALSKLVGRQANLLRGVARALKGPPPEDTLWSHHDLPEVATAAIAERDARIAALETFRTYLRKIQPFPQAAGVTAKWLRNLRDADAVLSHPPKEDPRDKEIERLRAWKETHNREVMVCAEKVLKEGHFTKLDPSEPDPRDKVIAELRRNITSGCQCTVNDDATLTHVETCALHGIPPPDPRDKRIAELEERLQWSRDEHRKVQPLTRTDEATRKAADRAITDIDAVLSASPLSVSEGPCPTLERATKIMRGESVLPVSEGRETPGPWTDEDRPLPEDDEIMAAHPMRTGNHERYAEAARLVGAKRSKYALIDLVNWLLAQPSTPGRETPICTCLQSPLGRLPCLAHSQPSTPEKP